jgi:hypothetical protein
MAEHVIFKASMFDTTEFKALGLHDQASLILENQHLLEYFGPVHLEILSTILIKSMCTCCFLDFVTDELSGVDSIFVGRRHTPSCPAVLCPIIEDMSVSQLAKRQRTELLFDHAHLLILEETSSRVKRKEKHAS